jgi:hypothetical protein
MDAPSDTRRPALRPTRRAVIVTGLAVVAILGALLLSSRPGQAPSPSQVAAGSPSTLPPSSVPTPAATPFATPGEAWEPLALGPFVPVASLTPAMSDVAGPPSRPPIWRSGWRSPRQ